MTERPTAHNANWAQARDLATSLGHRLTTQTVPVNDADRRVVAEPVHALVDLPGFDASAMDGWAVRGDEPWEVIGVVHAGDTLPSQLHPGEAVRIATGAPVPSGTDGIVRSEVGILFGTGLTGPVSLTDIRPAGEECRVGDLLADAGTELSPTLLGLLAASGHDTVTVVSRPRVDLLILGDEIQSSGVPRVGRVRDAMGPQVPAWLTRAGAEIASSIKVPDSIALLRDAITATTGDLIITTGSTAAGPRDFLRAAIEDAGGRLVVDEVAVRPGHPMLLAVIGDRPLVALPGNPQAAVVALLTLGMPLIDAQLGRRPRVLTSTRLAVDLSGIADRQRLVAGSVGADGFHPAPHTGPAMLRGVAASTGFAVIPVGGAEAGATVDWLALP